MAARSVLQRSRVEVRRIKYTGSELKNRTKTLSLHRGSLTRLRFKSRGKYSNRARIVAAASSYLLACPLAQAQPTPTPTEVPSPQRDEQGRDEAAPLAPAPETENPSGEDSTAGQEAPLGPTTTEGSTGRDESPVIDEQAQVPAAQVPGAGSPDTAREPEGEELVAGDRDPYEGLDHSGSPPPPAEESDDPKGEWDKRYDGRRKKNRAEDAIIWIPRAPLYPVHLVLNYGVRWPIVTGVAKAEEARLFHRVQDIFTFDDGKGGYYPTAFFDKGRGLWGGAHFYYDDWGREGHSIVATAGGGTNGWILGTMTDSWTVFDDQRGTVGFNVMYLRDPTLAFTGMGAETSIDDQVFFTQERVGGTVSLDVAFAGLSRFYTALEYRHARLLETGRNPALGDSDFSALTDELVGFESWFDLATLEMRLELDTRKADREFSSGSGLRWESWGSYNVGVAEDVLSFFRYGVEPRVLWDITGANHVLAVSATAEALTRTGGDDVPLSETVSLGGADAMKAFLPGRFRGESALVYGVAYSWPVLAFADALLFTDLGTAFEGFYDDFSHDKMALAWGTGARTSFSRQFGIELLVAWGSNRMELWDEGFDVDNVRFVVGVGRGVGK